MTGEILPAARYEARDTFGIVGAALGLADTICDTEAVPKAYRGRSDAIVAIFLQGYELGLGPMQSLRSIVMIQGTPTLKAETMRALVMRAGHDIDVEATDEACTVRVHRRGWAPESAGRRSPSPGPTPSGRTSSATTGANTRGRC